jgi:hypothetical protein
MFVLRHFNPFVLFQISFSHKPIKYIPKVVLNKLRVYMLKNIFQKLFFILLLSYEIKIHRACIYNVSIKNSVRYDKYVFKTDSEPERLQAVV